MRLDVSLIDGLGESYLGVSDLALPLPFLFPFEALYAMVDWTTFTLKILPGFLGVFEGGEGAIVVIYLCLVEVEEALLEV